ncbi:hypothetical protein Fcan01_24155 [Folsomia candida]|uniref:Uncharacterized protein n=1 Tax=Folsomia candida TaxID=158441 RepID=A0A226D966_FOLCA|nr:hypothetical protein Fcan01_24155 [Folsomia candida]
MFEIVTLSYSLSESIRLHPLLLSHCWVGPKFDNRRYNLPTVFSPKATKSIFILLGHILPEKGGGFDKKDLYFMQLPSYIGANWPSQYFIFVTTIPRDVQEHLRSLVVSLSLVLREVLIVDVKSLFKDAKFCSVIASHPFCGYRNIWANNGITKTLSTCGKVALVDTKENIVRITRFLNDNPGKIRYVKGDGDSFFASIHGWTMPPVRENYAEKRLKVMITSGIFSHWEFLYKLWKPKKLLDDYANWTHPRNTALSQLDFNSKITKTFYMCGLCLIISTAELIGECQLGWDNNNSTSTFNKISLSFLKVGGGGAEKGKKR